MSDYCYWILTDGTIVKPDRCHILAVADVPIAFGETLSSLEKTFAGFAQGIHSNFEGKAREITLRRIIQRNHIRIRKNQQKRNQHWSIQLYNMNNERRSAIARWAKHISSTVTDRYGDVIIHQLCDGSQIRTSLDRLQNYFGKVENAEIVSQTELKRRNR